MAAALDLATGLPCTPTIRAAQNGTGGEGHPLRWRAQVWSDYAACYVTIAAGPEFETPEQAIRYGNTWAGA